MGLALQVKCSGDTEWSNLSVSSYSTEATRKELEKKRMNWQRTYAPFFAGAADFRIVDPDTLRQRVLPRAITYR